MATVDELTRALVNADKAGDVDAARVLAKEIGRLRSQPAQQAQSGQHLSFEEGQRLLDQEAQSGAGGKFGAFTTGAVDGIPIAGPAILGGVQRASAALGSAINGKDYADNLQAARTVTSDAQAQNPMTTLAGNVTGATLPMVAAGSTALGAQAMGITGRSLGTRAGASLLSSGALSSADTAARGGSAVDVINSGGIGALIGGAIPVLGAGIKTGLGAVADKFAPTVRALTAPDDEAARRVGVALTRDATANPASVMTPADEAAALAGGVPLVNADRGGEVTRALTRSVANQSPEARQVIDKTASDRFGAQSQRASAFIKKVMGGQVDDLAYQENLRNVARATNRPAYAAAENAPEAQAMFTPRMQELMQSPTFRKAVDSVPRKSADRGAVEGFKEIGNPFTQNSQGAYVLRRSADGTMTMPNLKFWDQVQRNLRSAADKAAATGDRTTSAEIKSLRGALLDEVDTAVPAFKAARQGAAGFFGAEDALDAGRKFANTPKSLPEARKALSAFKPAEQDAFATGYASELIDKIKASGDRTNVINSMFKSQASRESIELALGPQKAREIEAYVRVEDLADRLRGAMGNSTTARQLVELGIGAGVGGGAGYGLTGDWKGALVGAAGPRALKYAGQKADTQVMESMAKLLMQDSPSALAVAVQRAARTPSYMTALENLSGRLAAPSRAIVPIANQ